ncbi:MAG: glycosyltransferase family 39 protein [Anaerolineae bacterium]|nr:glycosyltransferase family 39 protein [Anaerolineae bacterium]
MNQRLFLFAIIGIYLIGGILHLVASPIMEVWDEPWHYPVVQYIATHQFALPVQDRAIDTPWRQQGNQPPLYYLISAALTAGIDTSDMTALRRMNPHAAVGYAQPDGNANLIVHRPDTPLQGTALAVYLLRVFSLLLGLGTIWITYQLAREVFPEHPWIAIGAAALNAFLPMFVLISASVSNDNLSNLLGNGLALILVRFVKRETAPPWHHYALLGVVTGAGLLSKLSIGFFIPVIALVLLILSLRLRDYRPLIIGGAISGGLTILIAGWWYLRNLQLYGDPTGLNVFLDIVGRRNPPATWDQLWTERFSFLRSYWGAYGSINILLPDMLYMFFDAIGLFSLLSALVFLINRAIKQTWTLTRWLAVAITLILPVLTMISLIRWTTETPGSQGRLVFIALSSLSLWMAVGLSWWLRFRPILLGYVSFYFAAIMLSAPFLIIAPAYAKPAQIPVTSPEAIFSDTFGLQAVRIITPNIRPGDHALIEIDWQMLRPTDRNWSLFVHLLTPDGVIIGQRDVYPGGGKLATADLTPGFAWINPLAILTPRTAFTPNTLSVNVGWYDLTTGERLTLPNGDEMYTIGTITLDPYDPDSTMPNPLNINFDHQIALVGYDLDRLSAAPGEALTLTLYWRGLRPITRDYVVFANIIEPQTLTKYADSNAMPVAWTRPTTTWTPDELIIDSHTLTVYPDALPGIYELEIGLYLPDPDFPRLQIVPEVGQTADNLIYLSRIRILPPRSTP